VSDVDSKSLDNSYRLEAEAIAAHSNDKLSDGDYYLEVTPVGGKAMRIEGKIVATNLVGYWRPIAVDNKGNHYLHYELIHKPVYLGYR
jgi:hypothetical protein